MLTFLPILIKFSVFLVSAFISFTTGRFILGFLLPTIAGGLLMGLLVLNGGLGWFLGFFAMTAMGLSVISLIGTGIGLFLRKKRANKVS